MRAKKIGLALSGGGGKGAYQVGVWQAMRELGLDRLVASIAGTSVGGLNGAMIAQGKFELARHMWLHIESRNMLSLQDWPTLANQLAKWAAQSSRLNLVHHFISTKGLFSQQGLASMIEEGLPEGRLGSAALPLYLALHDEEANQVSYHKAGDNDSVANLLLATAALPLIFDPIQIEGRTYTDGGFYWGLPHRKLDNTPLQPLIENGCDTIFVIYLSADEVDTDPCRYPGVRIIPVVPTASLGGIAAPLDFSNDGAARRMELGYRDGMQTFGCLEQYLNINAEYEALWQRVLEGAEQARRLRERQWVGDLRANQTVADMNDFDRLVRQDDFRQPMAAPDQQASALDQLSLDNAALLDDLARQRVDGEVENFLGRHRNNSRAVEAATLDALATLAPVTGRSNHQQSQGLLQRFWHTLTGGNHNISAQNDHDLAQAQFAALRLIAKAQESNALSLEFACTLQNRLNGAYSEIQRHGERHNRDLQRVYRSMAGVYSKLRDGMLELRGGVAELKRGQQLLHWLAHPNKPRRNGLAYAHMPVALRLACMANDFFHLTEGSWSAAELHTLWEMCEKVQLGRDQPLRVAEVGVALAEQAGCASALTERLALGEGAAMADSLLAGWLRGLRQQGTQPAPPELREAALVAWAYPEQTELPAWDFLTELLYHLKAAGYIPHTSSDLGVVKAEWLRQLQLLDDLVAQGILPSAFTTGLAALRAELNAFRVRIPLVGRGNVGKSTLLNCWLGEKILPAASYLHTAFATEFHYALPGQEKMVVHWAGADGQAGGSGELPLDYFRKLASPDAQHERQPLVVELHLRHGALAQHPDIVLVDTPGLDFGDHAHMGAMQRYLGESVSSILCVTRISLIGQEEVAFLARQRALGQQYSVLLCQDRLVAQGAKAALKQTLAAQARLETDQYVYACAAEEGDFSGFADLLAKLESEKSALLARHFAPQVTEQLESARRLLDRQLRQDSGAAQLREEKRQLDLANARLEVAFEHERAQLLRDCKGSIRDQMQVAVGSFLHGRRAAYAQLLMDGQEIGAALVADARNASERAAGLHLIERMRQAGLRLESQMELPAFDAPPLNVPPVGPAKLDPPKARSDLGSMLGAAAGMLLGSMIGNAIGAGIGSVIGAGIGKQFTSSMSFSEAEGIAVQAIEKVLAQLPPALAAGIEEYVGLCLESLHAQIQARLQTQRQNLERIEQQLLADMSQRQQLQTQAEHALRQVAALLQPSNGSTEQ